jgi:hypothetical protein
MKKLSLLLMAVAFLCPKVVNAQDGKGAINFVPYVGVNYSNFSGNTNAFFNGTSGKVNFMAGARFEFQVAAQSAVLVDMNYRRLGATMDNDVEYLYGSEFVEHNKPWVSELGVSAIQGPVEDNGTGEIRQLIMDKGGIICEFKKFTVDCISLGLQLKQNVMDRLSVRAGIESWLETSRRYYYHQTLYLGRLKDPAVDPYKSYEEINHDDYDWVVKDYDDYSDMDEIFSDKFNLAIPLGLTYDYKNFSVNATYHLPLTKCADDLGYSLRHQAFDLTIGYRLPLRKR